MRLNGTEHEQDANGARARGLVLVFLAYVVLAILMTWPVAAELNTQLAGSGVDMWTHQWTFDWIKDSLLRLQNPFYTYRIFYPHGVGLGSHNIAWLQILFWIPLQAVLGSVAAYNVLFIGVLAFNGLALYWLACELTASRPGAFVAGLVYAFWPYVLSQSDHPNMIFTAWVPLTLLFTKRALAHRRKKDTLLAALCLALTGWVRWHLLIMGAVIIGLYVLYLLLTRRRHWLDWDNVRRLVVIGAVAGLLMLPIATPVIARQLTREHPEDLFIDEQETGQTDLLAFVVPSSMHTLWGTDALSVFQPFHDNFDYNSQVRTPFVGYTALLLALIGAVAGRRRSRFWVLAAIVYFLLALGPILEVNGHQYLGVPMPFRLVENNLLIRLLRKPDRFNVFLSLPVAMLAAFGLAALLRYFTAAWRVWLVTGVFALLILGEYAPVPFPQTETTRPGWLVGLADDPDDYALLHLPHDLFGYNKLYMFYQIPHEKPLVNGKVARPPREAMAFWESTPLMRAWSAVTVENLDLLEIRDVSHQLEALARENVRYIVIQKAFYHPGYLAILRDWMTVQPYHEDEDLLVYRTAPEAGVDFTFAEQLTPAVGLIRVTAAPAEANHDGTIKVEARWGTTAPPGRDYDVCLVLSDEGGRNVHTDCREIAPEWPSSRWQANEVVRAHYVMAVPPTIPAGSYDFSMTLAEPGTEAPVGDPVALGAVTVHPFRPEIRTHAVWHGRVALPGYDLRQTTDTLDVTFYWRAVQAMNISYKVFVHLIDPETGAVLAQQDVVPRNWTYPTLAWEQGEIVRDTVTLPLGDVPPGRVELWVGLYGIDEETTWRLPVLAGAGLPTRQGAVRLTTIER